MQSNTMNNYDVLRREIYKIRKNAIELSVDGIPIIKAGWKTKVDECVEYFYFHNSKYCTCIRATSSFDIGLAEWLVKISHSYLTGVKPKLKCLVINPNVYEFNGDMHRKEFDCFGIAPPVFEEYLKAESVTLHSATFHVFPMFGIEFRMDFTPEQYKSQLRRRDRWNVDIQNWNRIIIKNPTHV